MGYNRWAETNHSRSKVHQNQSKPKLKVSPWLHNIDQGQLRDKCTWYVLSKWFKPYFLGFSLTGNSINSMTIKFCADDPWRHCYMIISQLLHLQTRQWIFCEPNEWNDILTNNFKLVVSNWHTQYWATSINTIVRAHCNLLEIKKFSQLSPFAEENEYIDTSGYYVPKVIEAPAAMKFILKCYGFFDTHSTNRNRNV